MSNNKTMEDMIASGELSVMTECAYGSAIADSEQNNTLNKNQNNILNKNKKNEADIEH